MTLENVRQQISEIDAALDNGFYEKGMWQRFLRETDSLPDADKRRLADDVSIVSRKLHGRNGFARAPFMLAFAAEIAVLVIAIVFLWQPALILTLTGVVLLALTLQPTIKIVVGLLLGIRYDYAFLWYVEPRFKMRYGTYFVMDAVRRVWFHLAGSIGTPLALLVGALRVMNTSSLLGAVCLLLAGAALAMQVGAFAAQWMGVNNVGGFRLANLTSPATAAYEWRRMHAG